MLKQRVITALILAPLFLAGLFATNEIGFGLFLGAIVTLGGWEWARIAGLTSPQYRTVFALAIAACLFFSWFVSAKILLAIAVVWWCFAFLLVSKYPSSKAIWENSKLRLAVGFLVLVPAWKALVSLRDADAVFDPAFSSTWLIVYVLFIVWSADVGAYFAGKSFGRNKLAPKVSPGKSIEGAIGGLILVSVLPVVVSFLIDITLGQLGLLWVLTILAALFSILGDLLESMGKRVVGIKDSSHILPGHGGILDRIDSVTAAAPVFALCAILLGWISG